MKKLFLTISLSMVSLFLHGDDAVLFNGYQEYKKEALSAIENNGYLRLDGTQVSGAVKVNGQLKAKKAVIQSLEVNGQVELDSCVISGDTLINGSLDADETIFQGGISIASDKTLLRECSVNSITVRANGNSTAGQVVDLRGGNNRTHVTGSITFEAGNGEVCVSSSRDIVDSQVIGGKVRKK